MNPPALRIGTWLSIGSSAVAELAGLSGFDWVLFDLEHGCQPDAALPDQLRALRGSATQGIVRVGAPHPDLISRVLDWGAAGVMVPHVNSAAEAERVVQAACHGPRGTRGVARTVRSCDYGLRTVDNRGYRPVIMAQIETVEAVQRAGEIARVDGISVLFVGPADLQYDLSNHPGAPCGDYASCLQTISDAARDAGITAGILLRELADVEHHRGLGFSHIAVDSDLSILRKAWQRTLSEINR
jgi:2-dehydro-3-deoxyglucarate aldolase/4-hydroxy-2-oxoheptanedioate aldolase